MAPQLAARGAQSEDCLHLNVWTAGLRDNQKRPVLVYFHGGAYNNGTVNSDLYDGRRLVHRGDVVVVTVNHRLNAFGYLYLGDLEPEYAQSGNAGQLDLVLALEWVRAKSARTGAVSEYLGPYTAEEVVAKYREIYPNYTPEQVATAAGNPNCGGLPNWPASRLG